ncbi:MAG: hypothetical protein OEW83_08985 [Acidimicrobiia bacterium]|nr:hypothetical protein [Acidimicrobiia bacterium]
MPVQKLQTVDGFVVRDFADTPSSGIIRRGRKILQRSATDLARSATYAFAFHGIERGGASGGLDAEGDEEGPALIALMGELRDDLIGGQLELLPAKGIDGDELAAALDAAIETSGRATDTVELDFGDRADVLTAGVMAATSWALDGGLDGRRIVVEGDPDDPIHQALTEAVTAAGATAVEPKTAEGKPWMIWSTEADLMLVGSRPGAMNHQGAELLDVAAVVPWAPLPITTKALAVMIGRNITYVPDFVSASGPLVAHHLERSGTQLDSAVHEGLSSLDGGDDPLFMAACHRAEAFLATWQDKLPFGRPLAG